MEWPQRGTAGEFGSCTTMMKFCAQPARIWSAVTCHRFWRFGDLSPKQGRVQRPARVGRLPAFDGDKSPAESADKSTHSKVVAASPRGVDSCYDPEKFCSPARIFAEKEHKERKSNCIRLCDLCVLLRQSSLV